MPPPLNSGFADAIALRDAGQYAEAEARLADILRADPTDAPARAELGRVRFLQGIVAPPGDAAGVIAMARTLAALRGPGVLRGADEGPRLQRAAELVQGVLPDLPAVARPAAWRILWRTAHYAAAASLGELADLSRPCALADVQDTLLCALMNVETDADRRNLLQLHTLWAGGLERTAAERPIERPPRRPGHRPLRLGFLSSDLREHPVGYFAQPLFQHLDARFELYAYSALGGPGDAAEAWFAGRTAAFRRLPPDDRDAAALIASDDLDMLIELGGATANSRPGAVAYRPAPLQASWLGYPHSLGLSVIDYFIADPWLRPPRDDLLLEAPLEMPESFVCIAPAAFQAEPAIAPDPPSAARGYVTFGTANDPLKFGPRLLETWAKVVAAVPGSRFMIIRPEAGAPSFRENVACHFAAQGVGAERLDFRAVRGGVRALYAEMDIALDTFPMAGGTTTCEALWMGVPTVSLVGPAVYERLGWSILNNAGLAELAASDVEDYIRVAVRLAGERARLAELRRTLRARIQQSPLGQPERFAKAFYDLIGSTVAAHRTQAL